MFRYTWRTGVLEFVMVLVGLLFLFPIYVLVILSLKAPGDQSSTLALPEQPTFQNFVDAWQQGGLGGALVNSTIVTGVTVALTVVLAAAAAYPLSRLGARWSRFTYLAFLAGLTAPRTARAASAVPDDP